VAIVIERTHPDPAARLVGLSSRKDLAARLYLVSQT
jgi:hypothetical protein